MSHFNLSLAVWVKSQDSVHKPQFLKRKESRSGSNRGPSAYQPSALPLGHTGSQENADALRGIKSFTCGWERAESSLECVSEEVGGALSLSLILLSHELFSTVVFQALSL